MKQDVTRKQGRIEFIYEHFFFFFITLYVLDSPLSVPSRRIYFFQCARSTRMHTQLYIVVALHK